MTRQLFAVIAVTVSIVAAVTVRPEADQSNALTAARAASTARYVPAKTPWGDPDIQGGYSNKDENGIPFERPGNLSGKQLGEFDDSELAELAQSRVRTGSNRPEGSAAERRGPARFIGTSTTAQRTAARGCRRSAGRNNSSPDGCGAAASWPRQGRPAAAPAGPAAGPAAAAGGRAGGEGGRADSYTDRSFYDRCITRGLPGSMMPAIYGNAYDITQAPGLVAVRYEMVHETRVIPLNNSPRSGLRSHMGDARGHFEGDTLVVETTNFDPRTVYRNASPKLVLVEKFKPVAKGKLEWSVTVNDPDTWVRPWTFAMMLTADPEQTLFEYACHEGNYAMRNILSAARAEEAAAAKQGKYK